MEAAGELKDVLEVCQALGLELAEALVLSPPDGLKLQVLDIGGGRIQARAVAP